MCIINIMPKQSILFASKVAFVSRVAPDIRPAGYPAFYVIQYPVAGYQISNSGYPAKLLAGYPMAGYPAKSVCIRCNPNCLSFFSKLFVLSNGDISTNILINIVGIARLSNANNTLLPRLRVQGIYKV